MPIIVSSARPGWSNSETIFKKSHKPNSKKIFIILIWVKRMLFAEMGKSSFAGYSWILRAECHALRWMLRACQLQKSMPTLDGLQFPDHIFNQEVTIWSKIDRWSNFHVLIGARVERMLHEFRAEMLHSGFFHDWEKFWQSDDPVQEESWILDLYSGIASIFKPQDWAIKGAKPTFPGRPLMFQDAFTQQKWLLKLSIPSADNEWYSSLTVLSWSIGFEQSGHQKVVVETCNGATAFDCWFIPLRSCNEVWYDLQMWSKMHLQRILVFMEERGLLWVVKNLGFGGFIWMMIED